MDKIVRILQLSDDQLRRIAEGKVVLMDNKVSEVIMVCSDCITRDEIIESAREALGPENVVLMNSASGKLDG